MFSQIVRHLFTNCTSGMRKWPYLCTSKNGKKRIEGKEHINLVTNMAEVREKGGEAKFSSFNLNGLIVDANRVTEDNLKAVLEMCNYSITIK